MEKIILVLDVGATNVRSIAVSEKGKLLAMEAMKNTTAADPHFPGGLIWDVEDIWGKLKTTTASVLGKLDKRDVGGITVTSFGVDGAPVDKEGNRVYPVISWQCPRTAPVMANIDKYIPLPELYAINGLQPFSFNTINKLVWFRENRPDVLEKTFRFLFFPSLIIQKLTGEKVNDTSMAGTSMLTCLATRNFDERILHAIGIPRRMLPDSVEPGTIIGTTGKQAAGELGVPAGIPVIATGHDTQFAVFGSGAGENEPVLSSGTWDILMVRSKHTLTDTWALEQKVTTEFDSRPGLYNIGVQWIASGMLEWIMRMFYARECGDDKIYDTMIREATEVPPGANGVFIHPSFFPDPGSMNRGAIMGLLLNTPRGEIYRAAIESLAYRTRQGLEVLERAGNFKADAVICVGGGSKNNLLNQLRCEILDLPLKLVDQKETTVLGAAMFALAGIGIYASPEEARFAMSMPYQELKPSGTKAYELFYRRFLGASANMGRIYRGE
jgi:L-fuculokinase